MSGTGMAMVFGGAGFGALLRWWLAMQLNSLFPTVPLGTVAANLAGGLLVGGALAFFEHHPELPPEWRLLAVTGFLGGLTTFSTFSADVVTLIVRSQYAWALATAGIHLAGSLLLTGVGLVIVNAVLARH
jgi:CrcB protein